MLSANTVAQKPSGTVMPALSRSQDGAVTRPCSRFAPADDPSLSAERSSPRERHAVGSAPATSTASAGRRRRARRAVDERILDMAQTTCREVEIATGHDGTPRQSGRLPERLTLLNEIPA